MFRVKNSSIVTLTSLFYNKCDVIMSKQISYEVVDIIEKSLESIHLSSNKIARFTCNENSTYIYPAILCIFIKYSHLIFALLSSLLIIC